MSDVTRRNLLLGVSTTLLLPAACTRVQAEDKSTALMTASGAGLRLVSEVVKTNWAREGAGFMVRRPFPVAGRSFIDPFLLLDHIGPVVYAPGKALGAPDHPHRGFETVSYFLEGYGEHRDSQGNVAILGPGDVQWMTAGAGIVHSELPEESFRLRGGLSHEFQIWVNLPRRDKMAPPGYQEVRAPRTPIVKGEGVTARVIAGDVLGQRGAVGTYTPITFAHVTLEPGARFESSIPAVQQTALAYVVTGAGVFGPDHRAASDGELVVFSEAPGNVRAENPTSGKLDFLLLAGQPLREPVARYGPFVMNTQEEIQQAFEDYRSGKLGRIQRG